LDQLVIIRDYGKPRKASGVGSDSPLIRFGYGDQLNSV
jgi:hypothetical protein